MEDAVFTGAREQWRPLYLELKKMTEQAVGPFEERPGSRGMLWRHSTSFAELGAKKDCLTVAFAAGSLHDEWEPVKVLQTSKNRVVHYFEARDAKDFPALVEGITAAYALTKPAKPPKRENSRGEFQNTGEYIALFESPQREILQKVRETIQKAAPMAVEKISYQMPTFYQNGNLIHFSAAKSHLGVYPGAEAVEAFQEQLAPYHVSKGAIRFPWNEPIPYGLIAEITRHRVTQSKGPPGQA
jgi:uncharacterized protein YdhG (YjbR/CyaY superfamily)